MLWSSSDRLYSIGGLMPLWGEVLSLARQKGTSDFSVKMTRSGQNTLRPLQESKTAPIRTSLDKLKKCATLSIDIL